MKSKESERNRLSQWTSITVRKETLLEFQDVLYDMRHIAKKTKIEFTQDDAIKELIKLYRQEMK